MVRWKATGQFGTQGEKEESVVYVQLSSLPIKTENIGLIKKSIRICSVYSNDSWNSLPI
jgi:hypothetical protein